MFYLFLSLFLKSMTFHFGEGGHYTYQVVYVYQNKLSCAIVVNDQPRNSYIRKYTRCKVTFSFLLVC